MDFKIVVFLFIGAFVVIAFGISYSIDKASMQRRITANETSIGELKNRVQKLEE